MVGAYVSTPIFVRNFIVPRRLSVLLPLNATAGSYTREDTTLRIQRRETESLKDLLSRFALGLLL
jgi:hypothetical protein